MKDLTAYQDKFSEKGKQILESALGESRRRNQHFIAPEHLLSALINNDYDLFDSTMKSLSIDSKKVISAVEKRLENSLTHEGFGFRISPDTTEIFKLSMDRARSQGRQVIDSEDIISVFLTVKKDLFDDILQNPENPFEFFKRNQRDATQSQFMQKLNLANQDYLEAKQKEWLAFHEEQKKFLSNISWEAVIKNNKLISDLTALGGGGGSGDGGGGAFGDNIRYNQHSSTSYFYQVNDIDDKQLEAIISSLKIDVENCLMQNQFKITKTQSFALDFTFEYEKENLTGKIKISGEITPHYFQLSVNNSETSIRKA